MTSTHDELDWFIEEVRNTSRYARLLIELERTADRRKLLSETCPEFIDNACDAFSDQVIMGVSRITDPQVQGSHRNFVLESAESAVDIPILSRDFRIWSGAIRRLEGYGPSIRDYRNKHLGHLDRRRLGKKHARPLSSLRDIRRISHALDSIIGILDRRGFDRAVTDDSLIGVDILIMWLRRGKQLLKEVREGKVVLRKEDME